MRLIVGLGNPGSEYEATRHNVGERAVRAFAEDRGLSIAKKKFRSLWGEGTVEAEKVACLLPQTFMNRSGEAVSEAARFLGLTPEEILVVHDDIDLAMGKVKADFDAGPAGHRGVTSVTEQLGSQRYSRVRIGIGRPTSKEEVESYVLSRFAPGEEETVVKMVAESAEKIVQWIRSSVREGA